METSHVPLSLAHSDFSSQFISSVGDTKCNNMVEAVPIRVENSNKSEELFERNSSSPSEMEVSVNFSPDERSAEKSDEQMLPLELSKMSVREEDQDMSDNRDSVSPERQGALSSDNMSPERQGTPNCNEESEELPEQSLEMSIEE